MHCMIRYVPIISSNTPITLAIQCTEERVVQAKDKISFAHSSKDDDGRRIHTKYEQPDRNQKTHIKSWNKSLLRGSETVFLDLGFDPIVIVEAVTGHADHQSYNHREECQVGLSKVEAVDNGVYQWERFEERIKDSVDQRGIDSGE